MKGIMRFLSEARSELKKVSWPDWEEVNRSTIVVFVAIIIFTLFIYFADKAISLVVEKVLG